MTRCAVRARRDATHPRLHRAGVTDRECVGHGCSSHTRFVCSPARAAAGKVSTRLLGQSLFLDVRFAYNASRRRASLARPPHPALQHGLGRGQQVGVFASSAPLPRLARRLPCSAHAPLPRRAWPSAEATR
jgi:hypothetical protein